MLANANSRDRGERKESTCLVNAAQAVHVGTNPNTNCCLAFILRLFSTKQRIHK